MKTIKQPNTSADAKSVTVEKDYAGDLKLSYEYLGPDNFDHDYFYLDAHRARQLYNAIGEEMGFNKPAPPRQPAPKGAQAYRGNGQHKWEPVTEDTKGAGYTYRLRVPGGWVYRTVTTLPKLTEFDEDTPMAQSTVFVPVPDVVGYAI
jgi:hypothetical protein